MTLGLTAPNVLKTIYLFPPEKCRRESTAINSSHPQAPELPDKPDRLSSATCGYRGSVSQQGCIPHLAVLAGRFINHRRLYNSPRLWVNRSWTKLHISFRQVSGMKDFLVLFDKLGPNVFSI